MNAPYIRAGLARSAEARGSPRTHGPEDHAPHQGRVGTTCGGGLLAVAGHGAVHFALRVALFHVRAFVGVGLAAYQRNLNLGQAAFVEIDLERDDGLAALGDLISPLLDLPAVHEQFSLAGGVMLSVAGHRIMRYVASDKKNLAVADAGVGLVERCGSGA